jgi:pimeloyl-ACP methyl ester carboxylesterase
MRRVLTIVLLVPVALLAVGAILTFLIAWRIEARYPPVGRFVEVEGGRLHYVEEGPRNGEALGTIVFIHGASSNHADAALAFGTRLTERYRVIAFDRPGHGWSDRIAGREAGLPARQAAILADGMRKLGLRNAVVVGHSWGGSVAPSLALDHADVTGGLVLISAVTHPWPGGQITWYYHPATSFFGWLFTNTITTPLGILLAKPAIEGVFAPQVAPPDYYERAKAPMVLRPRVFRANAQDVAGLHAAVAAQAPRYGEIRVPTVVIGGDADKIVWTNLHSRSFAAAVPGAELVILPGVGHMPHHSHADLIAGKIEAVAARAGQGAMARVP